MTRDGPAVIAAKARYIRRESRFFLPHLHSTPTLWGSSSEYCHIGLYRLVWENNTVSQKTCAFRFCQNFVKFPQILTSFGS